MTYAQLTVLAEAAYRSVFDLLYTEIGKGVDLEVGFDAEDAKAAASLAYNSVIEAGRGFVRPIIEVD